MGTVGSMLRIAFDIGGTFTDFVLEDGRSGTLQFHKVPTTPRDPAEAVLEGLATLLHTAGAAYGEVTGILHATTVATNAILERKGALVGTFVLHIIENLAHEDAPTVVVENVVVDEGCRGQASARR